jgi:hypothetical protein
MGGGGGADRCTLAGVPVPVNPDDSHHVSWLSGIRLTSESTQAR